MSYLPSAADILETAEVLSIPLRTRFRGQERRDVLLFQGPCGWAEFSPFPEYPPTEAAHWLACGIEAAWEGLGSPRRRRIPLNATLPAVSVDQVDSVLARYGEPAELSTVKIKVAEPGQSYTEDLQRITRVHELLPQARIRVDANAGWDIPTATRVLGMISEAIGDRFEYAEQPVSGVHGLLELREALAARGSEVVLAADEAIRKAADPLEVARLGAAEVMVIKAPPLGGVGAAVDIIRRAGLDVVISSALDTPVGLATGVALAARVPELKYACGLATTALFSADICGTGFATEAGNLVVPVVANGAENSASPRKSGTHSESDDDAVITAPAPDPEAIKTYRADAETRRWWVQRLHQTHQLLEDRGGAREDQDVVHMRSQAAARADRLDTRTGIHSQRYMPEPPTPDQSCRRTGEIR